MVCQFFISSCVDPECDQMLDKVIKRMGDGSTKQKPQRPRKPIRHNKPDIDNLGMSLIKIFGGKDATLLSGITDYTWMQLLSETGTELSRWPSEKHFTSWLGLSPGQHSSGKTKRIKEKQVVLKQVKYLGK